jgi:BirA family transcriptional regulator, biotin operon repressor / biotin---[acetyl-CoA-carboxylase] ligase
MNRSPAPGGGANRTADRLDAAAIAALLCARSDEMRIEVLERCTSTNALLLGGEPAGRTRLLAAEVQTAGRGRRGRRWHSPQGAGLTFSLARQLHRPVSALQGLSLVAGVAAARALRGFGAADVALKWPNDLVARGAKLGGVLVETRSIGGSTLAVIGIGINWRATPGLGTRLRREVIALEQILQPPPARNALIAAIADALLLALAEFEARGLERLRADWEALHAHAGERIRVRLADGRLVSGVAAGIAGDGALRLHTRNGPRDIHSARIVTVRPAGAADARRSAP